MNKYYIPSIEEFHVGFEYEGLLNNGTWEKQVLTELSELNFEKWSVSQNNVRVKYLDEQDFSELGWQHIVGNKYYIKNQWGNQHDEFNVYELTHTQRYSIFSEPEQIISIRIYDYYDVTRNEKVKGLLVKNKSELKRLMKMLRIN